MNRDAFYTPPLLADDVAAALNRAESDCVADYAVGNGHLLSAVGKRFGRTRLIGIDIDATAIRRLKRRFPGWVLSTGDFLRDDLRCRALRITPSAIVMNPPYSCRGNAYHLTRVPGQVVRSGLATAFLLRAVQRVAPGGAVLALMPEAALHSEKDAAARSVLTRMGKLRVLARYTKPPFEGCSVQLALVRLEVAPGRLVPRDDCVRVRRRTQVSAVSVLRGGLPVHEAELLPSRRAGIPFLHTTSLSSFEKRQLDHVRPFSRGIFAGPGVVFPRVGVPSEAHFRILRRNALVQASDCIMFVRTRTAADAAQLLSFLQKRMSELRAMYSGTGARYVTVASVSAWLNRQGISAHPADGSKK